MRFPVHSEKAPQQQNSKQNNSSIDRGLFRSRYSPYYSFLKRKVYDFDTFIRESILTLCTTKFYYRFRNIQLNYNADKKLKRFRHNLAQLLVVTISCSKAAHITPVSQKNDDIYSATSLLSVSTKPTMNEH